MIILPQPGAGAGPGDALLSRIEDAGLNASAPPEQRWLDGWLLRFNPGSAKRSRCINAVADGRLPLNERLQRALEAYREHGLPPIVRITPFTQPAALDAVLAGIGWRRFDDTRVMLRRNIGRPDEVAEPVPAAFGVTGSAPPPLAVSPLEFTELIGALRGTPPAQRLAHARRVHATPVPYQAFVMRDGAAVLACGQLAIEGDLAGLYDLFTAPAARGRGLATALCHWLLRHAVDHGARQAYLQVDAGNIAARSIYRRLAFDDAYAYHYRVAPAVMM